MLKGFSDVMAMQLFKDWLIFREIGLLDTAVCNSIDRVVFKSYFQAITYIAGSESYQANEVFINWLLNRNLSVRHMNIKISNTMASRNTRATGNDFRFISRLETFRTSGICQFNMPVLCQMSKNFSSLLVLRLVGSRYVDDNFVITMISVCKQLVTLELNQCTEVTDMAIMRLSQNCLKISELLLIGCNSLTNGSVHLMVSTCPIAKITLYSCTQLTTACLSHILHHRGKVLVGLHLEGVVLQMSDVVSIGTVCAQLQYLSLRSAQLVSNDLFPSTANANTDRKLFHSLQSLDVSGNIKLSSMLLISLLRVTNVFLTELKLSRCKMVNENAVDYVLNTFKFLESVDLSHCEQAVDRVVTKIAEQYAHQLKTMNIGDNFKIHKTALSALAKHCHKLESLDLSYCSQINTGSVLSLLESPCATTGALRKLYISDCKNIDEKKVKHFIENCGLLCKLC